MGNRHLSDDDRERLATMREAGKTYAQIAEALGRSKSAISWHCLRLAAESPRPHKSRPDYYRKAPIVRRGKTVVRAFTPAEDTKLLQLEGQGLKPTAVGRALGRRDSSIRNRLMTLARRDERAVA